MVSPLDTYRRATGAEVNVDKTEGNLLGTLKGKENECDLVKWTTEPVKVLGVLVNNGEVQFWQNKITKMKNNLVAWKRRNLTLSGRVYLLKSVGLSSMLYGFENQSVPQWVETEVNKLMWGFIWQDKQEKVKRVTCKRSRQEGGLSVPDISACIKAIRLKTLGKIMSGSVDTWKILPLMFMGAKLDQLDKCCCLTKMELNRGKIPEYYVECLNAWHSLDCKKWPKNNEKKIYDYMFRGDGLNLDQDDEVVGPELSINIEGLDWKSVQGCQRKDIYKMLLAEVLKSKHEIQWEEGYGKEINWKEIYRSLNEIKIPRKIKEFSWKCINNAVTTENRLKQMKLSDGMCRLCGNEIEDLSHLLVDCETIVNYWKAVINLIRTNVPRYKFQEMHVTIGCFEDRYNVKETGVISYIIMFAKWMIWKRRCVVRYEQKWINEETLWKWYNSQLSMQKGMQDLIKSRKHRSFLKGLKLESNTD